MWRTHSPRTGGQDPAKDPAKIRPRSRQDPAKIPPRSGQDPAKIPPRSGPTSAQDAAKIRPRSRQDPAQRRPKMRPRSGQDPAKIRPNVGPRCGQNPAKILPKSSRQAGRIKPTSCTNPFTFIFLHWALHYTLSLYIIHWAFTLYIQPRTKAYSPELRANQPRSRQDPANVDFMRARSDGLRSWATAMTR